MKKVFAFLMAAAAMLAVTSLVSCSTDDEKKDDEKKDEACFVMLKDMKTKLPGKLDISLAHKTDYTREYAFVAVQGKTVLPQSSKYPIQFEFEKGYGTVCVYASIGVADNAIEALKDTYAEWVYSIGPGSKAAVGDKDVVTITYDHGGTKIAKKVQITIVE